MGDELDVDALLEAPINKEVSTAQRKDDGKETKERSRSRSPRKSSRRSRSKDRDRSSKDKDRKDRKDKDRKDKDRKDKDRKEKDRKDKDRKEKDRSRDKEGSRKHKKRSRSRSRDRSSKHKKRSRSRSRSRNRGLRRSPALGGGRRFGRSVGGRSPSPDHRMLGPEERDARTIFVMQLSQRVRARDVEDFFSSVGKIRDVRLIVCNKTRRFKGIAYVEFKDIESVPLALGLHGQKILGVPVIVQPSQAEKNRAATYPDVTKPKDKGPMRLYVGSLHFNITEEMLRGIFEPFGSILSIQLMTDHDTGKSRGYGFITFCEAEDAKKAMEQMNGFELAGRQIKVNTVTEKGEGFLKQDADDAERSGFDLGTTGRIALMAKLAEGTGLKLPEAANQALTNAHVGMYPTPGLITNAQAAPNLHEQQLHLQKTLAETEPPIATECFMLSNMFDAASEENPNWDADVRDDVIEECNRCGGSVLHIYVDKSSEGNVYVKCASVANAVAAVNALHGRYFGGKVIKAAYVPLPNYHNLFPEAANAHVPLTVRK